MTNKGIFLSMHTIDGVLRRIDEARKKKGWNLGTLAKEVGKDEVWISLIMNKKRRLSVAALLDIANALGVDPASLVTDISRNSKEHSQQSLNEYIDKRIDDKINERLKSLVK